jgi:hypothetical protein
MSLQGSILEVPVREVRDESELCAKEWRPTDKECLREYQISIEFLSIGCIIKVGCKSIPFTTVKEGMKSLNDYIEYPYEFKKIWEKKFLEEE